MAKKARTNETSSSTKELENGKNSAMKIDTAESAADKIIKGDLGEAALNKTISDSEKEQGQDSNPSSSKVWGGGKQENSFEDSEELQAKLNPSKTSKDQNPSKENLSGSLSEGLSEDASSNTNTKLSATQNETHKLKRFSRVHIFGLSLILLTLVLMGLIWWFFKAQEVSAPAGVVGYSSKTESQSKSSDHQKETDFIN